jgi:lysophospholipase L1-like esterase
VKSIAFCCFAFLFILAGCKPNIDKLDKDRFEEEIVEFERENQYQGTRKGIIVFVGDGAIKNWKTLEEDFGGMPVKNRGFGTATIREVNHYFRRLTDPFQPEVLVMHAGESDLLKGATPEQVKEAFEGFLQQIAISNRASRVVYISIMPSPANLDIWPDIQQANALIKQVADANDRVEFIDISREMLDGEGKPIHQLFEQDGHSLNTAGYARWAGAVVPVVERMF